MNKVKTIICAVTNDLIQDQRMDRVCRTLEDMSFNVSLWGRVKKDSMALIEKPYRQRRFTMIFDRGPFFYLEYNIRFIFSAIWARPDIVYSVDTDTLPGSYLVSKITGAKLVFDAHEYFTEVPELKSSPFKKRIWAWIEKLLIPKGDIHIAVSKSLAEIYEKLFRRHFTVIRNVPEHTSAHYSENLPFKPYILYQGVLNEGRGLESMIDAMALIPEIEFRIVGWGDIAQDLINRAQGSPAAERIHFMGWLTPPQMKKLTTCALLGLNLLDGNSMNYRVSLANKFFDYMHAGIPSINMDFPEYRNILESYPVGFLLDSLDPVRISECIASITQDPDKLKNMKAKCLDAAQEFCWQKESLVLKQLFSSLSN